MASIHVLPPEVVNRIAAGEVVERPASVVKELLENAIDAGAEEITLHVEAGGKKRIRVRDNGRGLSPEDLPLAFQSHATSKLPIIDGPEEGEGLDLFRIETLGFRGEALASIAAVAELEIISRTADAECAYRFRPGVAGRGRLGPEPIAAPAGTTIDVRNLFGNTPARREFLRAVSTEFSHIVEQVLRVALGFPAVAFFLYHGKRKVVDLPRGAGLHERLGGILGDERARELVAVGVGEDGPRPGEIRVGGFVCPPHIHRADSRGQNFFLNGRWIRDRVLAHALREAYQGYQISGRQPVAYVFVEVPREQVDINVHPQKTEVRFHDSRRIHSAVLGAVRRALEVGDASGGGGDGECQRSEREAVPAQTRERLRGVEEATRDFFESPPRAAPPRYPGYDGGQGPSSRSKGGPGRAAAADGPLAARGKMETGGGAATSRQSAAASREGHVPPDPTSRPVSATAFQVLREFIVTESPDGLVLMDQHALHEKVLYERILRQLRETSFPSQRLLLPEVVNLPRELAPLIADIIGCMQPFGFELEPFGEREIAINAVPVLLDRAPAQEVVLAVAGWVRENPRGEDDSAAGVITGALHAIAAMMACKQAVKAGMKLDREEITALLEESEVATDSRFCPHGRPTSIVLTRGELERRFDRR